MPYVCRIIHPDRDLTDAVKAEMGAERSVVVMGLVRPALAPPTAPGTVGRVLVTCSQGHLNACDVTYRIVDHIPVVSVPPEEVVGQYPTAEDLALQKAAGAFTLDQSLGRIQDYAKTLLSTVSVVGSILTGFALLNLTALKSAGGLIVAAILLSALSVLCALASLFLDTRHVLLGDLDAVKEVYRVELAWRYWVAVASGVLLVAALVLAALALVVSIA